MYKIVNISKKLNKLAKNTKFVNISTRLHKIPFTLTMIEYIPLKFKLI